MGIVVGCRHCKASFQVKNSFAGKRGKCPKCGNVIEVPLPTAVLVDDTPSVAASGSTVRPAVASPVAAKPTPSVPTARKAVAPSPTAPKPVAPAPATSQPVVATPVVATPVAPKPAASKRVAAPLTEQRIAAALSEELPPLEIPASYRLGIAVVSAVMIILPVLYILLIGVVGWLLFYHAVNHTAIFTSVGGRASILAFLLYAAPLVAGVTILAFMFKPLFARPASVSRIRSVTPKSDPMLFAFVNRLCDVVGAPRPKRIDVDADVNASAGFRRGVWSMIVGRDLVLTIGLPLVGGLSLVEFAGVLAHEFGHFSQGAGMRLSYVIRRVNMWLARAVYERDEWDEQLEIWARESDLRIGVIFHLARLGIWLNRRVLWVFMIAGHAVSCLMSRQMEFDADRQETMLAGSDAFEATTWKIHVLSVAAESAQGQLGFFYQEGRLADNYPGLIIANVGDLTAKMKKELKKYLGTTKTGWFDTHPCPRDRVAKSRELKAPGLFRMEGPATALFSDFTGLSRGVTWDMYRGFFGPSFQPSAMHPLEDLLARIDHEKECAEAFKRFFLGGMYAIRPLPLDDVLLREPDDLVKTAAKLRDARKEMAATRADYNTRMKDYLEADDRREDARVAKALLEVGVHMSADSTKKRYPSAWAATQDAREAQGIVLKLEPLLKPFEQCAVRRLTAALSFLSVSKVAARIEQANEFERESTYLISVLEQMNLQTSAVFELSLKVQTLVRLFQNVSDGETDSQIINRARNLLDLIYQDLASLRGGMANLRYPFDHVRKDITMAEVIVEQMPVKGDAEGLHDAVVSLLEIWPPTRNRLLGRLALIAEKVETALGLEPLPAPPSDDDEDE
ncbi:MAG: M48 family metalloprotease [Pirellulales bacterium]|nr:M48 family metalloprotease [Pirellulales bacterium]